MCVTCFLLQIGDTMCVVIIRQTEGGNKYLRNIRHWCEDHSTTYRDNICLFFYLLKIMYLCPILREFHAV